MPELKHCPFCGRKETKTYNVTGLFMAACKSCCAKSSFFHTKEDVISAWNIRTSGWIPCSERMPEPETQVMVYGANNEGDPVYEIDWIGNATRDWQYWNGILTVTHWMPLPEPPKGETP